MRLSQIALVGAGLVAVLPAVLSADNLTVGTAANYVPGQGWATVTSAAAQGQRFYKFTVVPGRSYCAETAMADDGHDITDTQLLLLNSAQTTLANNDDIDTEPSDGAGSMFHGASRVCWIAPSGETVEYVAIKDFGGAVPRRFRVSDTSLWSPWFFSGNGFEAFILIKNTTNEARTLAVSLYGASGAQTGSTATVTIPANGSQNFQVSAAPFSLSSATGTVQISHTAAPGGIVATVTSLSFASGVSFDAAASPRQDFRQ